MSFTDTTTFSTREGEPSGTRLKDRQKMKKKKKKKKKKKNLTSKKEIVVLM